ncbi:glycoside hydrolase family 92 protein, partial [Halomonas sp. MG34]|nr:glycoside hydrolase family 92 protein [Halomonas sp. MG34]
KENKYVQGLQVNGEAYTKNYITHEDIAEGGTLDFDMGPEPSDWGSKLTDLPESITPAATDGLFAPESLGDVTDQAVEEDVGIASDSDGSDTSKLFDNTSRTQLELEGETPWIQYQFTGAKKKANMYTLTSANALDGSDPQAADPKSWVLKGSDDGENWTVLDERENKSFKWRKYTRAFEISEPEAYSYYQLEITDNAGHQTTALAEVELLGYGEQLIGLAAGMQDVVDQLVAEGEFKNNGASRSLLMHLTAVERFEEKGDEDKVVKHMEGFQKLLDQQHKTALISEDAYKLLKGNAAYMLQRWE